LAAFTMTSICGTASAVMNNPNPSTPAPKPPVTKTKPKLPADQTTSTSSAVTTSNATATTTSKAMPNANQTPLETHTPTPNSSTTTTSSNPRNQPTPTPAADPKKDIVKQNQDIKKYDGEIAQLQGAKQIDPARLVSFGTLGRTTCDNNGNCTRSYTSQSFGNASVFVKIRVDAKGNPLPGEFDKMLNAQLTAIDKAIAYNAQLVADAYKQIGADYDSLPGHGNGGNGGVDIHTGSTALHQN